MIYKLKVMRATGMRWQEARALKREDIQFETREYLGAEEIKQQKEIVVIHICHSVGSISDEMIAIRGTKTAFSERTLPYDAADLFKEILSVSRHDVLFADYDRNLINLNRLTQYILDISDLRAAGVPEYIIQKFMGHKPGSAVTQVYGSPSDDILLESIVTRKYKE